MANELILHVDLHEASTDMQSTLQATGTDTLQYIHACMHKAQLQRSCWDLETSCDRVGAMVSFMWFSLAAVVISAMAAPKRILSHDDLVKLLNERRDHEAWSFFRHDLAGSNLPPDLVAHAIHVMDQAYHAGALDGAPGSTSGGTASHPSSGSTTSNIEGQTGPTTAGQAAPGPQPSAPSTMSQTFQAMNAGLIDGPVHVPETSRNEAIQEFANDDYSRQVRNDFQEARRVIARGRFTDAGRCIGPHTHLVARSCQHLLDVLSGRASLVNLEVVRPTSHALRVLPQVYIYTDESEGSCASDEDACRQQASYHAQRSIFLHARSRPWIRRLPVRGRRCRNIRIWNF